jgi:hypothetical protein
LLDGCFYNWTKFHEEFANDNYLSGPEFSKDNSTGKYKIKVSNTANLGKYILVVGKKEKFSISETIATI